jgi:hypothetical protein
MPAAAARNKNCSIFHECLSLASKHMKAAKTTFFFVFVACQMGDN